MVRIPESSKLDLISKLKHMVNLTAQNLGEIVDLSHEFAIGMAEHFDALHRVSEGDLSARVYGSSQVELLESLKRVTNEMIQSVAREISQRERAEKALPGHRGHLAQMNVEIIHLAAVDLFASGWIRIVWQAEFDALRLGECTVEFGTRRCAGPYLDGKRVARSMGGLDPFGERQGYGLGIAGGGKPAHSDRGVRCDERCRFGGAYDFRAQRWIENSALRHLPSLVRAQTQMQQITAHSGFEHDMHHERAWVS